MAFNLLSLPPELIHHIASFVPVRQLPAVACACSTLCAVARRRLYRHLSVSPALHNLSVVITLAKNRVLAKHVRSFCVNVQPAVSPFKAFYRLLAQALHAMTDVVQLHVFIGHEASWILPSSSQLAYPQLLNFACSFPFNSHVAHFLQLTPSLLELEVGADYPCPELLPSLPPTVVPHLVQFAGPSSVGRVIVPGRPVNSIFLHSGDLNEFAMDSLIQSTAQISALCGMTSQPPVSVLECLSHRMPQLAYLRLMTTFEFPEAPDIAFYENVAKALTRLPQLQAFELSGMQWGSQNDPCSTQQVWQALPIVSNVIQEEDERDISDVIFAY